jgi:glutaredoxin 3
MPPPPGINTDGLVMFGTPNCPGCDQAARWLANAEVSFRKYDVSNSPQTIVWLQQATGQRTVPQFFLNGHHLAGGYNQLMQLAATGQLPKVGITQLE